MDQASPMDVDEAMEKIGYHQQMAAAWKNVMDHLANYTSDAAVDVIEVIGGITDHVSRERIEELRKIAADESASHVQQIDQYRTAKLSPVRAVKSEPRKVAGGE
jgi:hypothetical protein